MYLPLTHSLPRPFAALASAFGPLRTGAWCRGFIQLGSLVHNRFFITYRGSLVQNTFQIDLVDLLPLFFSSKSTSNLIAHL